MQQPHPTDRRLKTVQVRFVVKSFVSGVELPSTLIQRSIFNVRRSMFDVYENVSIPLPHTFSQPVAQSNIKYRRHDSP